MFIVKVALLDAFGNFEREYADDIDIYAYVYVFIKIYIFYMRRKRIE